MEGLGGGKQASFPTGSWNNRGPGLVPLYTVHLYEANYQYYCHYFYDCPPSYCQFVYVLFNRFFYNIPLIICIINIEHVQLFVSDF